nr:PBP1A family penicillin-binding protein [Bacillus alkalicola]
MTRRAYRKKRKRKLKRLFQAFILCITITLGAIAAVVTYAYQLEPPSLSVPETTVLYSKNDEVIGEFHHGQNRHWIPIENMGDAIVDATLAIEDRRFHDHYGLDFYRIGGAVVANLRANSMAQGGSTITQQYARNLYLDHSKTWTRKLNEALYALRLELHYSKEDILEGYLNTIYYGHGAYGIEAAANVYFQKHAEDLTHAEAALLAGIPKGPNIYSPFVNEERAIERQQVVLSTMVESGFITSEERQEYANEPLEFSLNEDYNARKIAPAFQDVVRSFLTDELNISEEVIESGGLEVHTTLDPDMQKKAEDALFSQIGDEEELEAAFVAMDPRTGEVKAMIGGTNYTEGGFNRATMANRQPGSTIKPFLYYAALEHGMRPNSMLKSEYTSFLYEGAQEPYQPENFNDKYKDDYITMLQALAVSDNIFAVKTHFLLGFDTLEKTVRRFGIESPMNSAFPAVSLGSSEVGVMEIINAYSPFANGGYVVEPQFVTKVVDRDGDILYEADNEPIQELDPSLTAIMTNMMEGVFEPNLRVQGIANPTGSSVSGYFDRPIAGKSGTTENDSWMIGYTPQLLSGVWVGYDNPKRLEGMSGHTKEIWAKFMHDALEGEVKLPFPTTDNVIEVDINPETGMLATDDCPVSRPTLFYVGTQPTEYCTEHIEEEVEEQPKDPNKKSEEEKKEKWLDRFFDWIGGDPELPDNVVVVD